MTTTTKSSDKRDDEGSCRTAVAMFGFDSKYHHRSKMLLTLAIGMFCAANLPACAQAAAPIPETFAIEAPAGRHDTVAQVTMDDGAKLWVKVLGDEPGKPLLIVHHGAPGVSSHLEPEASFGFLADRYRVLVFDARGSGYSDLQEPYSHARWVEDVDALRRWAGADKFVLAGGSYGTFISLEYALRHPEHLDAVILRGPSAEGPTTIQHGLDAALKAVPPEDDDRQRRMWAGQMRDDEDLKLGFEEFARVFAPPPGQALSADEKQPTPPPLPHFPLVFHAATHDWAFARNLPSYDVRERLASIHVPMLVTVGRYDQVTVPTGAELIAQRVPGAKLVVFEHSGHSVPADEPSKFRETVNGFLDLVRLDTRASADVRPLVIGETFALDSPVLGETRRINVYLPPVYSADPAVRLPVLYMPDGGMGEDFLHVAGLIQVLVGNGTMRPFLLVGIENTQRRRDLTGPTDNEKDKQIAPRVGGSAAFRKFLREELKPRIQERYRTTGESAIVGESLAGLFVMETFLLEPDLFDTYLAFDPSLWWNDQVLIKTAEERLKAWSAGEKTLYFGCSGEPSLAPLTRKLADVLTHSAPAQVHWHYEELPMETHATIYHPAALQAFRAVFKPTSNP